MRARPRRRSKLPDVRNLRDAMKVCPFKSLVAIGNHDLAARVRAGFAAIGGEVEPIEPERLAELVDVVRQGGAVVVMGTTDELRNAAKAELMLALSDAVGTA